MRVGFMTYDSKINFYNINGALTQPQQMTVGDVNDMFVPLADGLMVSADDSEAVIDSLMEQIPQMFADTRETETILGPVIQAGKEAFKVSHLKIMKKEFRWLSGGTSASYAKGPRFEPRWLQDFSSKNNYRTRAIAARSQI